jgi:hypothetical protein
LFCAYILLKNTIVYSTDYLYNNKGLVPAVTMACLPQVRALEGLTVKGEEKDIVREIWKRNREGEVEMQVTAAVKELKRGNRKSMRGEEWKAQDGLILFQDRIYIPKNAEL